MVKKIKDPVVVDKWDGNAVKNTLDDCVKQVMTEHLPYVENHNLINGRLILCTLAALVAGFAMLWDYLHPFPKSRDVLIACVLIYFTLSGILTLYITFVEKGIFLVAVDRDLTGMDKGRIWKACSQLKRYDDKYCLRLSMSNNNVKDAELTKSISSWFDEKGTLLEDFFIADVKKLHDKLLIKKDQ